MFKAPLFLMAGLVIGMLTGASLAAIAHVKQPQDFPATNGNDSLVGHEHRDIINEE
jgi:hypothetical protein